MSIRFEKHPTHFGWLDILIILLMLVVVGVSAWEILT